METNGLSLVLFLLFNVIVGGAVNIDIASGANYTFRSHITAKIQSIQWTRNNNLVVECDPPGNPVWYRFETQAELNQETGDLTVRALKKEDRGVFKGQFQVNGVLQYAEYSVTVIDPVSKPTVTCKKGNETHSTLMCTAGAPVPDRFVWGGPDGTHSGSSVQITKEGVGSVYFCTAENKVSKETTEFRPDSVCFGDPDVPNTGSNIGAGGIIGILLAVVAAAAGAIAVIWLQRESILACIQGKTPDAADKNVQSQPSNRPNADESMRLQAEDKDTE